MGKAGCRIDRGRLVVIAHLAVIAAFVAAYLVHPAGVIVTVSAVPIVAILVGFRINRTADRLPWQVMLLGLSLLTYVSLDSFIYTELFDVPRPELLINEVVQMAGYIAVLASSIVVVLRHAPQDGGRVIDAALVGMGAAAPIWEFVLRPRMIAIGASTLAQTVLLVEILVLLAALGSMLRISHTAARARPTMRYLFVSLGATLLGLILEALLQDRGATWNLVIKSCWIAAYLSLAAAALHPSAASLTERSAWHRDELSAVRLSQLGAVLLLIPIVGGVPQLLGHPPDGLLLSIGPLLATPLVLTRIGQLVTQRARDQRALAYLATHDELTGLANRRRVFSLAAAATQRLRTGDLASVAVLYCDLDGFKPINDILGHDAGDHVLRVMARRLRDSVRAGDTVGRIGGDEFVVLCPDAGPAEVDALRCRVEDAAGTTVRWQDADLRIGVSIGAATSADPDGMSADALLSAADRDMYARKRQRRAAMAGERRAA